MPRYQQSQRTMLRTCYLGLCGGHGEDRPTDPKDEVEDQHVIRLIHPGWVGSKRIVILGILNDGMGMGRAGKKSEDEDVEKDKGCSSDGTESRRHSVYVCNQKLVQNGPRGRKKECWSKGLDQAGEAEPSS
jgi:hypothetical protein